MWILTINKSKLSTIYRYKPVNWFYLWIIIFQFVVPVCFVNGVSKCQKALDAAAAVTAQIMVENSQLTKELMHKQPHHRHFQLPIGGDQQPSQYFSPQNLPNILDSGQFDQPDVSQLVASASLTNDNNLRDVHNLHENAYSIQNGLQGTSIHSVHSSKLHNVPNTMSNSLSSNHPPIHSPNHSPINPSNHQSNHQLNHSPIHSPNHSPNHSPIHPPNHQPNHPPENSLLVSQETRTYRARPNHKNNNKPLYNKVNPHHQQFQLRGLTNDDKFVKFDTNLDKNQFIGKPTFAVSHKTSQPAQPPSTANQLPNYFSSQQAIATSASSSFFNNLRPPYILHQGDVYVAYFDCIDQNSLNVERTSPLVQSAMSGKKIEI